MSAGSLLRCICRYAAVLVACAAIGHWRAWTAEPTPIKLAVFDFELEDASAGASIAGDPAADAAHIRSVSAEVRRTIEKSGRYRLVDVSGSDAQPVKDRALRACNGCEAQIAASLGAEQSLLGIVRRITRTEYVVSFQVRDARSGDVLAARESDLLMGADYSWSRGATRLMREHLLQAGR